MNSAEVDFLVLVNDKFIPVEVKSSTTGTLKSLHLLLSSNPSIPYAVKTSRNNFSVINKIKSIPWYAFSTWLKRARNIG